MGDDKALYQYRQQLSVHYNKMMLVKPGFIDLVLFCAGNKDLVAQFDRLTGSNLSMAGSAFDLAIDESTGRINDDMLKFIVFVDDCIYQRVPPY